MKSVLWCISYVARTTCRNGFVSSTTLKTQSDIKLLRRYFCYFVHKCTQSTVNLKCTVHLLMFQTANLLQLVSTRKKTMDGLRVELDLRKAGIPFLAYRRATKNSTAWQPTTARLLVMATYNSPIPKRRTLAKCNRRRTSQKIGGGVFLYGVYKPEEWLWIFELIPTVKMETRYPVEGSLGSDL